MNEIKKNYIDIDKTIKNINKELATLKEDLKNIEKLGKNYTNKDLFYQELSKINFSIGDYNFNDEYVKINVYGNLESISEWGFEDLIKDNQIEIIEEYLNIIEEDEDFLKYDYLYQIIQDLKNEG